MALLDANTRALEAPPRRATPEEVPVATRFMMLLASTPCMQAAMERASVLPYRVLLELYVSMLMPLIT
jgi:hypothetical protein